MDISQLKSEYSLYIKNVKCSQKPILQSFLGEDIATFLKPSSSSKRVHTGITKGDPRDIYNEIKTKVRLR